MRDAINEGLLRLYPPPTTLVRNTREGVIEIDIEHIHRNPKYWGYSTEIYDPCRWEVRDPNSLKEAFLPFGFGRFACPTRGKMGPRLLGVLVATLVTEIDSTFELVDDSSDLNPLRRSDSGDLLFSTLPLKSSRASYHDMLIRKVVGKEKYYYQENVKALSTT